MEKLSEMPMSLPKKRKTPVKSAAKKEKLAAKKVAIKSNIKDHKTLLKKSEKIVTNKKK